MTPLVVDWNVGKKATTPFFGYFPHRGVPWLESFSPKLTNPRCVDCIPLRCPMIHPALLLVGQSDAYPGR
ncbi:hypothetical protein BC826DRAFT_1018396 [Russula brevipes]|nr:hypothetical protein BC826DRAFT_1018396 [Russula brevipes]